jgi:hypothetical protein
VEVRRRNTIGCRSKVTVRKASGDVYAATIDDKVGGRERAGGGLTAAGAAPTPVPPHPMPPGRRPRPHLEPMLPPPPPPPLLLLLLLLFLGSAPLVPLAPSALGSCGAAHRRPLPARLARRRWR